MKPGTLHKWAFALLVTVVAGLSIWFDGLKQTLMTFAIGAVILVVLGVLEIFLSWIEGKLIQRTAMKKLREWIKENNDKGGESIVVEVPPVDVYRNLAKFSKPEKIGAENKPNP